MNIHFFSSTENQQPTAKAGKATKPAKLVLTGYISTAGKLVLPDRTVTNLGIDLRKISFKVGMDQGKRKSMYLVHGGAEEYNFFGILEEVILFSTALYLKEKRG